MELPKGTIPENVLQENSVPGYLKYLADTTEVANADWDTFGKAVSAAYSQAYDDNGKVLKQVRDLQKARSAADEAFMSFALSLLTVGVAGFVAGSLAKSGSEAVTTAARDVVKQIIKGGSGPAVDAVVKTLSPEKARGTDAFTPGPISPTTYMAKLLEGISRAHALLLHILYELNYDPKARTYAIPYGSDNVFVTKSGGPMTVQAARRLTEVITGTSYFQNTPPTSISSDDLLPKAALALWIGWALNRDPEYWSGAPSTNVGPNGTAVMGGLDGAFPGVDFNWPAFLEQDDWEPVRHDLLRLGVPAGRITARIQLDHPRLYSTGLFMWGFMEWAASRDSLGLLLAGKTVNDVPAVQRVYKRKANRVLVRDPNNPRWMDLPEPTVTPIEG